MSLVQEILAVDPKLQNKFEYISVIGKNLEKTGTTEELDDLLYNNKDNDTLLGTDEDFKEIIKSCGEEVRRRFVEKIIAETECGNYQWARSKEVEKLNTIERAKEVERSLIQVDITKTPFHIYTFRMAKKIVVKTFLFIKLIILSTVGLIIIAIATVANMLFVGTRKIVRFITFQKK